MQPLGLVKNAINVVIVIVIIIIIIIILQGTGHSQLVLIQNLTSELYESI
jgi:hypothetical protein